MEEYYPDPEKFDPERLALLQKWVAWIVETEQLYFFFKVESWEQI